MNRIIIFLSLLFTTVIAEAKVYDCFMFFNEIELLKLRLEELDDVVDYFVLVESAETQRGDPKPFYFDDNRHLFERFLNKIIYVRVDERHPEMDLWERENYQRNCIARGLQQCASSDLILISDLDEIPRPELIQKLAKRIPWRSAHLLEKGKNKKFRKHNRNKKGPSKAEKMFYLNGARAFEMSIYFFQLNRQTHTHETWGGGPWVGTVMTTYSMVEKFGVQHFRDYRWKFLRVYNGGWHFTWMGGKEKIKRKICSIVEGHPYGETIPDEELDRWINNHPIVPIDESFPVYVQRNVDHLKSLGFIADY